MVLILSLSVGLMIGGPVLAQPGPGAEGGPGFGPPPMRGMFGMGHLGMLFRQLNLDESQQSSIQQLIATSRDDLDPILTALRENREALDESLLDGGFDNDALTQIENNQKALVEAQAQLQYQIYQVFTTDQRAQLKTLLAEPPQRHEGLGPGGGGPAW